MGTLWLPKDLKNGFSASYSEDMEGFQLEGFGQSNYWLGSLVHGPCTWLGSWWAQQPFELLPPAEPDPLLLNSTHCRHPHPCQASRVPHLPCLQPRTTLPYLLPLYLNHCWPCLPRCFAFILHHAYYVFGLSSVLHCASCRCGGYYCCLGGRSLRCGGGALCRWQSSFSLGVWHRLVVAAIVLVNIAVVVAVFAEEVFLVDTVVVMVDVVLVPSTSPCICCGTALCPSLQRWSSVVIRVASQSHDSHPCHQ